MGRAHSILSRLKFRVERHEGFAGPRGDAVDRAVLVGLLFDMGTGLGLMVLLCRGFNVWWLKDRCALAVLAGSRRVDAVGGRRVGGLVFCGLFLSGRGDGRCGVDAFRFLNGFESWLLGLRASPIVGARVLTVLGARVRTAMPRESLSGKGRSPVPAGGDGEFRRCRDDYVCVNGFGCGCRLFAALAILRKGFAGKNDGLWRVGTGFDGVAISGSVIDAIERNLGSEPARNTGSAIITTASSTVSSAATIPAVVTIRAVVAVPAITAAAGLLRNIGRGVGWRDRSRVNRGRTICGTINVERVVAIVRMAGSVFGGVARLRVSAGQLRRLVPLARSTATAAATTTTPAAAAIRSGCAFAEVGSICAV
jgi:hypothetical protein